MSTDIEAKVASCTICEKFKSKDYREKLLPHDVPKLRYIKVGADIMHDARKNFLILIDSFFHWMDMSFSHRAEGLDYWDLLREHNNAPLTGLNVSPAQILFSGQVRTPAAMSLATLQPIVQEGIYEALLAKQKKAKELHDKTIRRMGVGFKEGDRIVIQTGMTTGNQE
ncbi:hypothetical protein PR048_012116 [Dryococelus australis]|uniref:Uncharacterized protein n=1 Tax=Dryococelus australis TaxID=614101 RepID=A0ABQ9HP10_9NEOP|nr:hypothetical protein PR048_012116 [Dryococelus australis]